VASAVGVIIEYRDRLLLTQRKIEPKRGKLDLPGGFVDYHESGEDCVRREIKEELNISLKEVEFFCSAPNVYEYKGVVYQTLDLIYLSKIKNINGIQARDDVADYKFLLPSELDINELAFDSSKYGITKYLRTKV
jgi:ADP-ribose pyrophosphatase YjhB (NUDIX family)